MQTTNGVHHERLVTLISFNFTIHVLMEVRLVDINDLGIDLLPGDSLIDLKYADDIVSRGKDADKMQSLLNTLSRNLGVLVIRFATVKRKMMLASRLVLTS